ncbi:MAG: tetratricopeptide repeat protein [Acidobacteriota bacterium]
MYREFPESPAATERVGLLSMRAGQQKEAVAALESAVKSSPTPANRLALAQAYLKLGSLPQAEALAAQLAAAEPQNFDFRMFGWAAAARPTQVIRKRPGRLSRRASMKRGSRGGVERVGGHVDPGRAICGGAGGSRSGEGAGGGKRRAHVLSGDDAWTVLNLKKEALEYYQKFLEASRTNPDQEFQARQRARILERDIKR